PSCNSTPSSKCSVKRSPASASPARRARRSRSVSTAAGAVEGGGTMKLSRQQLILFLALAALLAIFAGCKSESPTAPPSVGTGGTGGAGNPPAGGVTPPVGATLTL